MKADQLKKSLIDGAVKQNPVFRLVLGTCPTLAVTATMLSGAAMGLATMISLICSNFLISLFKRVIPDRVRIPAYILIIAAFVTVVDMAMAKFLPDIYETLGVFVPLIVVNCVVFARAEAFASANPVLDSVVDGFSMGLGFALSLTVLGAARELLGAGSLLGLKILGDWFPKIGIFALPAGGFLMLGLLMAAFNAVQANAEKRGKARAAGKLPAKKKEPGAATDKPAAGEAGQ